MANSPIGTIQGLASGIQWQDMIDQLIQVDTTRELTPLTTKAATETKALSAWSDFGNQVSSLRNAVKGLADGSAFSTSTVSASNSPTTGRTLFTATATSSALPGSYNVQVLDTAAAQQLSGNVVSDPTAALGLSGQLLIGGKAVSIASGDSLNAVRDKINAANTGATPSRVSATILSSGTTAARLVLTSDTGGASGIDLRDARASSSDASLLTQLGLISGKTANVAADGRTKSASFSSSSQTLSSMLGGVTSLPPAAAISVNGQSVTIDVSTQSLTDIAAAINAQSPSSASVETVTNGSTTSYRLNIAGTVAATGAAASQPILDVLGLTRGQTAAVKQQVTTANVLQDAGGSTATGTTLLSGLKIAGGTGAQLGDTFTIAGLKADGTTSVSLTQTVDGTRTINDMLSDIATAFSASGRSVSAAIVGGKIQLTDDTGGESGLTFSIAANNESAVDPMNPATVSFGATSTTTIGRQRELAQGRDARILVNGVQVTRSSNTISDAINGVTLSLNQAESGTTIPVTVSRDNGKIIDAVRSMASAYNVLLSWVNTNTGANGPLPFNASVRQTFATLKNALLTDIVGLPSSSTLTHAAVAGVAFNKTGSLVVDDAALGQALASNPDAVASLFKMNGVASNADVTYMGATAKAVPGSYDVTITRAATVTSVISTSPNFVFNAGASPDTMTITDGVTGKSGNITLVTGDTTDTVVQKLNTLFGAQNMRVVASNTGGALTLKTLDYGSTATFTVAYTSSDGTNMPGQLGIFPGIVNNGLDVQGTFSSGATQYTATGSGQLLTGDAGTPVDGLTVRYSGTGNSASSHLDFAAGIGGLLSRITDQVSRANDGTVATQTSAISARINSLTLRQNSVQSRLDQRRAALVQQFTTMEKALAKINSQSTWLTSQINSMNGVQSSKG